MAEDKNGTAALRSAAGKWSCRFLRLQISCCQPRGNVIRYLHDDSSAASCGAGLAQWIPTNHVRRGTEQH